MSEELKSLDRLLMTAKRLERHHTVAETRYWCGQYKQIACNIMLAALKALSAENQRVIPVEPLLAPPHPLDAAPKAVAFEDNWPAIAAELPMHQRGSYDAEDIEHAEREGALAGWTAHANLYDAPPASADAVSVAPGLERAIQIVREVAKTQPGYSDEREAIFEALSEAYVEAKAPQPPPASADAVSVPVELLERTIMNLLYGSARDNADELRALLAQSESKVKP